MMRHKIGTQSDKKSQKWWSSPQNFPTVAKNRSTPHSNDVTSNKQANTLICHTTMCSNPINFLYNLDHVTLWCVEVGLVANAREGSTQEHDWARVESTIPMWDVSLSLCSFEKSVYWYYVLTIDYLYCYNLLLSFWYLSVFYRLF